MKLIILALILISSGFSYSSSLDQKELSSWLEFYKESINTKVKLALPDKYYRSVKGQLLASVGSFFVKNEHRNIAILFPDFNDDANWSNEIEERIIGEIVSNRFDKLSFLDITCRQRACGILVYGPESEIETFNHEYMRIVATINLECSYGKYSGGSAALFKPYAGKRLVYLRSYFLDKDYGCS